MPDFFTLVRPCERSETISFTEVILNLIQNLYKRLLQAKNPRNDESAHLIAIAVS
jgi:hypothetical protein